MKQSSSNLSLNKNTSSNSLQANSPSPPKKPERSFIESGNNGDIFKFDCQIERNPIKQSNGSLDKVGANQNSDERRAAEKKKKKEKKEKRKEKERKKDKEVSPDFDVAAQVTARNDLQEIERKESLRLVDDHMEVGNEPQRTFQNLTVIIRSRISTCCKVSMSYLLQNNKLPLETNQKTKGNLDFINFL